MENKVEKNEIMTDTEELEKAADALLAQADEKPAPKKRTRKKAKAEEAAPAETNDKSPEEKLNELLERGKKNGKLSTKELACLEEIGADADAISKFYDALEAAGLENGKASIMASIEPVVATLCGIFIYNEALTVMSAVGILLVLSAIVLLNLKSKTA